MRWLLQVRWVWVALGLTGLGCASDESAYDQGRDGFCAGSCDGFLRCGLTDSGCNARCTANYAADGSLRPSGLIAVGDCMRDASCDMLTGDTPFDACFEQAAKAERLRSELVSYCQSASLNDFRCNIWWPVKDCTETMGLWEDAVLERARACHQNDCSTLQSCEDAVFNPP